MVRGPRKHLKRLAAPSHLLLNKMGGVWAARPSTGPHKLRECVPLTYILRHKLKYALNGREAVQILMQRLVEIDHKVRTDDTYPVGLMDIVTIKKTKEMYRILYDTKGRFVLHRVTPEEAKYKLCRVKRQQMGKKQVPYIASHDARTFRYPPPEAKADDTVVIDIKSGKITDVVKFEVGNIAMVTGGNSVGRVAVITHREKHPGSHDIIIMKDARGDEFATRKENVFIIGTGNTPLISLPKDKGIKKTILEEMDARQKALAPKVV